MRNIFAITALLIVFSLGSVGCSEHEKSSSETKIKTPGGTTTVTHETDVKKTGKNPPDAP